MPGRHLTFVATTMTLLAAVTVGTTGPATADAADPSDDCTLVWVTVEELEPDRYFGDARLSCPVVTTVGGRFELDGQEVQSYTDRLGPGEVPVFDDLDLAVDPGRQLCFVVSAWGNDKGRACLTT